MKNSKSHTKLKILMCSEASFVNSGFGKYAHEILSRLHATNKYTIAEFASYGLVNDPRDKNIDWIYYANAVRDSDPRHKEYMSRGDNQFGRWRFEKVLLDFKPDVVIDVRDFWMSAYQAFSPLRPYYHHILMPTVDSAPQQEEWLDVFLSTDAIFTYSDWGAEILKKQTNNKIKYIATTSPGVDLDTFYIMDRQNIKHQLGVSDQAFIIGSVMRNQKRKLIPELLSTFNQLLLKSSNSTIQPYLYLHTTYPDMGWDIPELLNQYQISNRVLFTYLCKNCSNIEASVFCGTQKVCKHCLQKASQFPSVSHGVSDNQLAQIYNLFDLYVQYAICEGFGMPQVEAGACGIPIATINYSAMTDIIHKLEAYAIEPQTYFKELETKAIRVYPNNNQLLDIILNNMKKPISVRNQERIKTRDLTAKHYNWDNISKIWENYLDNLEFRSNWENSLPTLVPVNKNHSMMTNENHMNQAVNICNSHLKNIKMLSSYRMLSMLKDADYGFAQHSPTQVTPASIDYLYDYANSLIDNNNKSEQARSNGMIFNEDFIQYAHIKNNT